MFSFIKRHKIISGLFCANIIAVIAVITSIAVYYAKTAVVDIYVAPSAATITLNGKPYENFQSYDLLPGDYHVEIAMDGMQTKEYDITLADGGFAKIHDYLLDSMGGGYNYYLTHPEDEYLLTQIASKDDQPAQKFISAYEQKAGILDILPIDYDAYTDDFAYYIQYKIRVDDSRGDCPKIACLVIEDNTGDNEQRAKDKIKEYGYNPDDYEIKYEYVPLYGSEVNNE